MNTHPLKHILKQLSRLLKPLVSLLNLDIMFHLGYNQFIFALISSSMRYGSQTQGQQNLNSHIIRDLEKIQNKAVNILKLERNSPNLSKLFNNDLGIMKFRYTYSEQLCICPWPIKQELAWCIALLQL